MTINDVKISYTSEKEKELKETLIYLIKIQSYNKSTFNFGIQKDIEYHFNKLIELIK